MRFNCESFPQVRSPRPGSYDEAGYIIGSSCAKVESRKRGLAESRMPARRPEGRRAQVALGLGADPLGYGLGGLARSVDSGPADLLRGVHRVAGSILRSLPLFLASFFCRVAAAFLADSLRSAFVCWVIRSSRLCSRRPSTRSGRINRRPEQADTGPGAILGRNKSSSRGSPGVRVEAPTKGVNRCRSHRT